MQFYFMSANLAPLAAFETFANGIMHQDPFDIEREPAGGDNRFRAAADERSLACWTEYKRRNPSADVAFVESDEIDPVWAALPPGP